VLLDLYLHMARQLTVKRAWVPVGLGCPGDRRGAERRTSGVNLFAFWIILVFD
jgi:hypothetical protein